MQGPHKLWKLLILEGEEVEEAEGATANNNGV